MSLFIKRRDFFVFLVGEKLACLKRHIYTKQIKVTLKSGQLKLLAFGVAVIFSY